MRSEQRKLAGELNNRDITYVVSSEEREYSELYGLVVMYVIPVRAVIKVGGVFEGEFPMKETDGFIFLNGIPVCFADFVRQYDDTYVDDFLGFLSDHGFEYTVDQVSLHEDESVLKLDTIIPHETFNILCDGNICSIGIIIDKDDLGLKDDLKSSTDSKLEDILMLGDGLTLEEDSEVT